MGPLAPASTCSARRFATAVLQALDAPLLQVWRVDMNTAKHTQAAPKENSVVAEAVDAMRARGFRMTQTPMAKKRQFCWIISIKTNNPRESN